MSTKHKQVSFIKYQLSSFSFAFSCYVLMLALLLGLENNSQVMGLNDFAYRPLLQELTLEVNDRGLDPYEAYQWLLAESEKANINADYYLSTSITSGGHARDDELDLRSIIDRNTESARLLAEQLAEDGQIVAQDSIEPVFVGKTHWNQMQFMEFWLSVISGFSLLKNFVARDVDALRRKAHQQFIEQGIDIENMISKESPEKRAIEYFRMSNAFANLVTSGEAARPIPTVVRMIDTETSLGAQAERVLARQIGSRVVNIGVVKSAGPEDLISVNRVLATDMQRLISFGATVFDTQQNRVRLILLDAA